MGEMVDTETGSRGNGRNSSVPDLAELYRRMALIREAETQCGAMFAAGEIPGFIHLSDGQEGVSVGVMASLRPDDTIASTHRGHGHALAKGLALEGFFAELMGRQGGACKGRGGSMHVADLAVGMLGANGIVGGGLPIALGSGLAHKLRGGDGVAVCFFGDGASAQGMLHEALNIAKLKHIPTLFVCENNGWSEFSKTSTQVAFTLERLVAAYDITYRWSDGSDVEVVAHLAAEVVAGCRKDGGPAVLEFATTRIRGHYEGDSQRYRNDSEAPVDPVAVARGNLLAEGFDESVVKAMEEEIRAAVQKAIEFARRSPPPTLDDAALDVYRGVEA